MHRRSTSTRAAFSVRAVAAVCLGIAMCGPATAQTFPTKPITIVVPIPPGGGPDVTARVVGERLAQRLGQPVVVENRPGVGGLAGASSVAKAAPDGHTLLVAPNTLLISPHLLAKGAGGGIDVLKDLAPVIMAARVPTMLAVTPQLGVKNVAEFVALAKRTSPPLAYASAGNGSPMHIAGELFTRAAAVELQHVPFRGNAPAVTQVLGGQINVIFASLGGALQHVTSGKLVPLALTDGSRSALLPGVPTLAEAGVSGVEVNAWYGVFAPAGTPSAVIARLNEEIGAIVGQAEVRERLANGGIEPLAGSTPEAMAATARDEFDRYGRIVREFRIQAD